MSKGLEALKRLSKNSNFYDDDYKDYQIIEKELKEKEKQDFVYNILKEVIQFNVLQPEIKETDNGYSFVSGIALKMQRELENKERQLFREWVLKECFPKELKALEIIKNIGILRPYETSGGQCWLETMCDATKITKDNYDLLKEAGL